MSAFEMSAFEMSAFDMSALLMSALYVSDVLSAVAAGCREERVPGAQLPLVGRSVATAFTFGLGSEDLTNTSRATLDRGATVTSSVNSGVAPPKSCRKDAVVFAVG